MNSKACQHNNFNDYLERCEDCGQNLDEMPQELQDLWNAQFDNDEIDEARNIEEQHTKAEAIRDSMREDGKVV